MAKVDAIASQRVKPPRVAQCQAALECQLHQTIHVGYGPGGANIVIGRIVSIHLDDGLLDEQGNLVVTRFDTVGRMGGLGYIRTTDRFELARPRLDR